MALRCHSDPPRCRSAAPTGFRYTKLERPIKRLHIIVRGPARGTVALIIRKRSGIVGRRDIPQSSRGLSRIPTIPGTLLLHSFLTGDDCSPGIEEALVVCPVVLQLLLMIHMYHQQLKYYGTTYYTKPVVLDEEKELLLY